MQSGPTSCAGSSKIPRSQEFGDSSRHVFWRWGTARRRERRRGTHECVRHGGSGMLTWLYRYTHRNENFVLVRGNRSMTVERQVAAQNRGLAPIISIPSRDLSLDSHGAVSVAEWDIKG